MINIESFYNQFFKSGNVFTDSRNIIKDGIFIALKGDNFNGNIFAGDAIKAGAKVAVIDEVEYKTDENIFLVENSLEFLQQLSQYHRKKVGFKIIAITGTNGKTTTKELIKSVLSEKYKCQSTIGNLNNHIGVPLTLLSIKSDTQFAIVEMGANHPGEIAQLCKIALPNYGLITNIGKAHLEGFGSFEGVIKTKSELYEFIKSTDGCLFYNASNPILVNLIGEYSNTIKYNTSESISGEIQNSSPTLTVDVSILKDKRFKIESNLYGEYNLENILAAVSVGNEFRLTTNQIISGIEKYIPDNNRSQILKSGSNTLILDCYNANPTSMLEAITSFSKIQNSNKILILGCMKELGIYSEEEHKKLIDLLINLKLEGVLLLGEEFKNLEHHNYKYFQNLPDLIEFLKINKYQQSYILIKGSRGNKLERIVEFLT